MPVNSKGESLTGAVKKSSGKELNEKHFQSRSGHCTFAKVSGSDVNAVQSKQSQLELLCQCKVSMVSEFTFNFNSLLPDQCHLIV